MPITLSYTRVYRNSYREMHPITHLYHLATLKGETTMADEIVKKRTRPDRKEAMSVHTEPGDNRKYLEHSMVMLDWPDVNVREPEQVKERMGMYFALCAQDDMKPSVAGMALAFGVDRKTIWAWANGVDSKTLPTESRNLIKKAYQLLNAQMESYMQNGKINPVAGIFLMKNNMGYADKQEVVLTPNQQLGDQVPAEDLEKKYLEDVVGASSDYDPED